ncbi:MAG: hypothetical protein KatS3mg118_2263 [Paracoccaceae bacterium]|nr:MAG: hypothetical protein KatS3mg118_2263 [Paracoccaceae bacterium]
MLGGMTAPVLLDSITDLRPEHAGAVVLSGSHGGRYPAAVASRGGIRAVVFNDAGRGLDDAGVAGVLALGEVGMAAAAADCMSCAIGSAASLAGSGVISVVNAPARALGLRPGMTVAEAAALLAGAPMPHGRLPALRESRGARRLASGLMVQLLDSASLVGPADAGAVVITGSHGGLVGGDPARALKAQARVAVFNDAGLGPGGVGISRLPALDARGIAALTVAHDSARIGEAASALETGRISHANRAARALGARPGDRLADWLATLPPEPG